MDWLDQAAANAKREVDASKSHEEALKLLEKAYPTHRNKLWEDFGKVFIKVKEKFGSDITEFEGYGDNLHIKVGDVTIKAVAEQRMLMGGFFGRVSLSYGVGENQRKELPPVTLLLTVEDPKWVFRGKQFDRTVNVEFGESEIEEVFKIALSKYINQ